MYFFSVLFFGHFYFRSFEIFTQISTRKFQDNLSLTLFFEVRVNLLLASDTSTNEEVEFLKQTVGDLSRQVAALQTELSAARLQEFEAHEAGATRAQVRAAARTFPRASSLPSVS